MNNYFLSVLVSRAAHFKSCYCLYFMIYYPYVYSVGPNFRIFSRTCEYPSRPAHPRSQRVTLAALGSTRVEHCELALDLVGAKKKHLQG